MPQVLESTPDCGGLLALPFMDDEPGLQIHQGGTSLMMGWNPTNATVGNVCKAALLSTMFNLRKGLGVLQTKGVATSELILTGGLAKTPECGQILADVFGLRVRLLEGSCAEEGCSWGAAVLAKYRFMQQKDQDWPTFLESIPTPPAQSVFHPNPEAAAVYQQLYDRYQKMLELQPQLQTVVLSSSR
jgi:sugar (pentulose or hexulose) kinase